MSSRRWGARAGVWLLAVGTIWLAWGTPAMAQDGSQQFADLHECQLESGAAIQDCRIGYRSFGTLNASRSNAVLVPSWFAGTSEDLAPFISPRGLVNPERYFVIVVDAFGNGVSSSPSNSPSQPGSMFPHFTIGDMVEAQHRLITEKMELESLAGVVGISMGGMQVFDWAVRFPDMARTAVSIAGTPRAGAYDRVAWDAYLRLMDLIAHGARAEAEPALAALEYLRGTSPEFVNRMVPRDSVETVLASFVSEQMTDAQMMDRTSQARAIAAHDVAGPYGGDLAAAASRVRAELTIILTESDHQVTPETSKAFAALGPFSVIALDNDCGHAGANCEPAKALGAVAAALESGHTGVATPADGVSQQVRDAVRTAPVPGVVETLADSLPGGTGGVAVDQLGRIYSADFGAHLSQGPAGTRIFRVTPQGQVSEFASGFMGASGNVFLPNGDLLQSNIANNTISRVDPQGGVHEFASTGLHNPVGLTIGQDGRIFVVNCGSNSISVIDSGGVPQLFSDDALLSCPNGVTAAADGNLYVSNFYNGDVLKVDMRGTASRLATLPGSNNGHLTYGNGVLYVAARGAHQIWAVTLAGETELVAGSGQRGGVDGPALDATLSLPNDLVLSWDGRTLYWNEVRGNGPDTVVLTPSRIRMLHLEGGLPE